MNWSFLLLVFLLSSAQCFGQARRLNYRNGTCLNDRSLGAPLRIERRQLRASRSLENVTQYTHQRLDELINSDQLIIDPSCHSLIGGEENLRARMLHSLQTGTQCLLRHGVQSRQTVARILALFNIRNHPFHLRCYPRGGNIQRMIYGAQECMQLNADAAGEWQCGSSAYPGIHLVNDLSDDKLREDTLFHEVLHNLGLTHNSEIDYVYLAETCCFATNSEIGQVHPEAQRLACELITNRPTEGSDAYIEGMSMITGYTSLSGHLESHYWFPSGDIHVQVIRQLKAIDDNDLEARNAKMLQLARSLELGLQSLERRNSSAIKYSLPLYILMRSLDDVVSNDVSENYLQRLNNLVNFSDELNEIAGAIASLLKNIYFHRLPDLRVFSRHIQTLQTMLGRYACSLNNNERVALNIFIRGLFRSELVDGRDYISNRLRILLRREVTCPLTPLLALENANSGDVHANQCR